MKKLFVLFLSILTIVFYSCKSNNSKVDAADSGQVHVGGSTVTDSSKYPVTPVETGGQDTTADGISNTNPAKDTLK